MNSKKKGPIITFSVEEVDEWADSVLGDMLLSYNIERSTSRCMQVQHDMDMVQMHLIK